MENIPVGSKLIGQCLKPFVIAEMSGNHKGQLSRALKLVDAAAEAGADAIKLQTYTANTMTLNVDRPEFYITDPGSPWYGRHLYELYEEAHTPWSWHKPIMDRAKEKGLICFSTPFDSSAVDFLEELDVPCYKIASFENTDIGLIKKVASTGKPIIISTGMAKLSDLELMVQALRTNGCEQFILLKCTSAYPASFSDCNLKTIPHLREMFDCLVGLSDHTSGIAAPIASVALGACVIEKHFTLSRSDGGVDSAFSLEREELKDLVTQVKHTWEALGSISYQLGDAEEKSKQFKRSVYFIKDMQSGELITSEHIQSLRPGFGVSPYYLENLIGRMVNRNISKGMPVRWEWCS